VTVPITIDINHIQAPAQTTFADIRDGMSARIESNLKIANHLQWHDQKDVPGLHVTDPVKTKIKLENGTEVEALSRFAIFDPGDGNMISFNFSFPGKLPEETQKYVALSDKMLASVKPAGKAGKQ
jgi:hypothetical protein